ncbi:YciI family protein [Aquabacter sp. P-9]|uniref:YciI family protein n=1 Tax=Aquabacter sediminis TaxID=3029197 RepID=UPI00237DE642|nr:YciI family protein [Aquabacter sp. P-9]MDE1567673.1 YciI family protein [Aquabacter sp. P-9]
MAYFAMRLRAPRVTFPFDATAEEVALMQSHGAYWHEKAQAGIAIVVGPVMDPAGPFGLAVVEVEDEAGARALGHADPVVAAEVGFSYEVMPMPSLILRRS